MLTKKKGVGFQPTPFFSRADVALLISFVDRWSMMYAASQDPSPAQDDRKTRTLKTEGCGTR